MTDYRAERDEVLIDKIGKLLAKAAGTKNEVERDLFNAKAMQLIADNNLDMAAIEIGGNSAKAAKRTDEKLAGGLYQWQRDLWKAVADLNFCMYWTLYVYDAEKASKYWIRKYGGKANVPEWRKGGVISWDAIEDRGRNLMGVNHYDSVPDFFNAVKGRFALDLWANQDWRPEVWIEKQALEGVIGGICNQLRVPFFSTKGYNSQSEQWRAGRRFASCVHKGQRPIVFHLGDHDPSGLDMTRDNRDRLSTFAGVPVTVVRIAMNRDQIDRFDCPENPVKFTDSRAEAYVAEHGYHSWELDALSPKFIAELIEQNVSQIRDPERWDEMVEAETEDRMVMNEMIRQYFGERE